MPAPYSIAPVDAQTHLAWASEHHATFMQMPSWAAVKREWRAERLGWYAADGGLAGVALVLYRPIPVVPNRYLAYVPQGPVLPWKDVAAEPASWLDPFVAHVRKRGAFTLKIDPMQVTRRWHAKTVKDAIAAGVPRLGAVPPDVTDEVGGRLADALRASGWSRDESPEGGFHGVQPRTMIQVPLAPRSTDEVFAGLNQQWRRNVRKAEKSGVTVTEGTYDDLPAFHDLFLTTARRDEFTPRPLSYFQRMWTVLRAEDNDRCRLYFARHEGEPLATVLTTQVNGHVWYAYGASADHKRELRPSNAVQWKVITDALADGCHTYDLRGVSDTLEESDPLFGLLRFKIGTGGDAVEHTGEWDLALRPLWARAVSAYLRRRG